MKGLNVADVARRVETALSEDAARTDATVAHLGIENAPVDATILAREPLVVCGLDLARMAFGMCGVQDVVPEAADGDAVVDGQTLIRVAGVAGGVLGAERVALNFLQRLSGIATLTSRFVRAVEGSGVTILDTRKTTPLWRDIEKYAVRCGGGSNHRLSLNDMILVKENHVRAAGGVNALLQRLAAARTDGVFVEVEVDSLEMLEGVLRGVVDRVMLDNFAPRMVRAAVDMIKLVEHQPEVEVSGGIRLDNVAAFAVPGVDFISVGALTHSARAADMSMEVVG